jgi:hypothetical protein
MLIYGLGIFFSKSATNFWSIELSAKLFSFVNLFPRAGIIPFEE